MTDGRSSKPQDPRRSTETPGSTPPSFICPARLGLKASSVKACKFPSHAHVAVRGPMIGSVWALAVAAPARTLAGQL
jgi:hypothetical protein